MIDKDTLNISDEMYAAYIDGNCSPLEKMIINASISDESVAEIMELANDCKELEDMNNLDLLDISSIVEDFTRPLKDYDELKGNIETPDNSPIM